MLVVNMLWFQYPLTNWTIISGWVGVGGGEGGYEVLKQCNAMQTNGIYSDQYFKYLLHVSLSAKFNSVILNLSDLMNHLKTALYKTDFKLMVAQQSGKGPNLKVVKWW